MISEWQLYSPPPPPVIAAAIDLPSTIPPYLDNPFRNYSFWTSTDANLTIVLASVLHLICSADYPVAWFLQDEETSEEYALPLYSALLNGTWENVNNRSSYHSWSSSSSYKIDVTTTNHPYIMISPVIESIPKIFICRANYSTGLNYATITRLLINSNTDNSCGFLIDYFDSGPRILLWGFDRFAPLRINNLYFYDVGAAFFFCFLPPGSEDAVRLITPGGAEIDAPELPNKSNVSGVEVWRERIVGTLWVLNMGFTSAPKGLYTLTTGVGANYSFEYVSRMYQVVSLSTKDENVYSAALYVGEIYEARLNFEGTFITGEVELFSQNYEKECQTFHLPANNASAVCGILALQAFQDYYPTGIIFIINATTSCSILVRLMINNTGSLNSIESILDLTVWEKEFSGAELMVTRGYLGHESNFISSGKVIPSNETVTLSCVFPVCTFEDVFLCKSFLDNTVACVSKEVKKGGGLFYFGIPVIWKDTTEYHLHLLSNHTLAFDVRFPAIAKTDSETYICGGGKKVGNKTESVAGALIDIKVEDASPPRIRGGNSGQIIERWIESGQYTPLTCEVDGLPEPELHWFEEDGSKTELMEKYFSKPSISVNKSGTFICMANNTLGTDERKFRVRVQHSDGISVTTIIAVVVPAIVVITIAIIIVYIWHRQQAKSRLLKRFNALFDDPADTVEIDSDRPLNDQTDVLSFERKYEINRDQFVLTKEIGHGQFGRVFKGELTFNTDDIKLTVAIKSPKDPENLDQYRDLLSEYKIMTRIRPHVNIVSLLGVCRLVEGKNFFLYVLTEFCAHGSLEAYLIRHWSVFESFSNATGTADSMEGSTTLFGYAYQAARGMKHLARHKIIHRDLALRNLLLTQEQVVKIADFGMSRRHETVYKKGFGREYLPIYWMAPESLNNREYSEKSDVWSFGVVLWEMFTCATPYQDQDIDGLGDLLWFFQSGKRLSKPQIASQELYNLMLDCWHTEASVRPEFRDCKQRLGQLVERKSTQMYSILKQKLYSPTTSVMPNSNQGSNQTNQGSQSQTPSISEAEVEDTANTVPGLDALFVEMKDDIAGKEPLPYAK